MQCAEVFCAQFEGGQQREVGCSEVNEVVRTICGEPRAYEGGVQEAVMAGNLRNKVC